MRDHPRVPAPPALGERAWGASAGHGCGALQTSMRSTRSGWRRPSRNAVQPPQSWPIDVHALDPERVEQRDLVGGEGLAVVAVARRLAPAEAAQVGREQPVALGAGRRSPAATCTSAGASRAAAGAAAPRSRRARLGDVDSEPVRRRRSGARRPRPGGKSSAHRARNLLCEPRVRCATSSGVGWAGDGQGAAEEPAGAPVRGARPARRACARRSRAWQREALADPALRPVPPEALHVTLVLPRLPAGEGRSSGSPRSLGRIGAAAGRAPLRARAGRRSAEGPPAPVRARRAPARTPWRCRRSSRSALARRALLQAREARLLAARDGRPGEARAAAASSASAAEGPPARVESRRRSRCRRRCTEPFGAVRVALYRSASAGRRAPSTSPWPTSTCRPPRADRRGDLEMADDEEGRALKEAGATRRPRPRTRRCRPR